MSQLEGKTEFVSPDIVTLRILALSKRGGMAGTRTGLEDSESHGGVGARGRERGASVAA